MHTDATPDAAEPTGPPSSTSAALTAPPSRPSFQHSKSLTVPPNCTNCAKQSSNPMNVLTYKWKYKEEASKSSSSKKKQRARKTPQTIFNFPLSKQVVDASNPHNTSNINNINNNEKDNESNNENNNASRVIITPNDDNNSSGAEINPSLLPVNDAADEPTAARGSSFPSSAPGNEPSSSAYLHLHLHTTRSTDGLQAEIPQLASFDATTLEPLPLHQLYPHEDDCASQSQTAAILSERRLSFHIPSRPPSPVVPPSPAASRKRTLSSSIDDVGATSRPTTSMYSPSAPASSSHSPVIPLFRPSSPTLTNADTAADVDIMESKRRRLLPCAQSASIPPTPVEPPITPSVAPPSPILPVVDANSGSPPRSDSPPPHLLSSALPGLPALTSPARETNSSTVREAAKREMTKDPFAKDIEKYHLIPALPPTSSLPLLPSIREMTRGRGGWTMDDSSTLFSSFRLQLNRGGVLGGGGGGGGGSGGGRNVFQREC